MRSVTRVLLAATAICQLSFSAHAGEIGSSKHGFSFDVKDWSIEDRGEENKYAYGLATRPDSQYRFWFILSKVTKKETDEQWQDRQLVKKTLPRFAKHHGGKCEATENEIESVSIDGAAGENHSVAVSCKDGHETGAAYVTFRSPDDAYRGFIWIYPNAGQSEFDESIPASILSGWAWKL